MTDNGMMDALFAGAQKEQLSRSAKVAPTLSVKDGVGVLSFEAISMSTFEAGNKMPGKHRWEGKHLRFIPDKWSLEYVKRTWPNVIILKTIPDAKKFSKEPPPAPRRGQMSWTPRERRWLHQQRGFDLAAGKSEFAYLWDMGTGKSKAAVDDAAFSFARGEIDRVLVIAPNGVHEQWINDVLPQHWPLELPCVRAAIVTGLGPCVLDPLEDQRRRVDWMADLDAHKNDCKWLAVNIENLKIETVNEGGRKVHRLIGLAAGLVKFLEGGPAMVILDESHKIKNPQAKRTLACWKLGKLAVQRRILTGSPLAKGIEDYYAQFRFLDPGIIGCYTFAGFKEQFCVMGGFNGKQITGYRDMEEFHNRIGDYAMRVDKKDVLDLPPKLYSERTCDMTDEQREMQRQLKEELLAELSDGTIINTRQMLPRMIRLSQLAQGFLPREDGGFDEFPENKTALLMDLLETAPDRTAIWCRFTHDIEKLYDLLGRDARCIRYFGGNKKDRPADKARWLNDSRIDRFIGNAQAGGTGLDWLIRNGSVSTVIYYSNSFSSIDRWQSEDRVYRFGTAGTVNVYDLVTRGTLDRRQVNNLKRKRSISDMSLQELKEIVAEL
jgi:hypothetical protein